MSQTTDFYLSWLGCSAFGANGVRLRDQEPLVFKPTDISGCRIWLDANDNDAVQYNDLLQVSSWSNKGTLPGQFDLSGGVVTYGTAKQNGLNTVTFEPNGFMSGVFNLSMQPRSIFYVFKPNTISKPTPIFTSDTTGHQEIFVDVSDSWVTFTGKHPSPFPEIAFETNTDYTGYAYMTSLIAGTDLSDNWCGYNGTFTAPIFQSSASFTLGFATYFIGNYFSGAPTLANYDMCELIIYEGTLPDPQRIEVEKYLRNKWAFTDPPPTPIPPAPFAPTDISGLYIWFDANNLSTITTDVSSNVLTWSNLGTAGGTASNNLGYGVSGKDSNANSNGIIAFAQGTDMAVDLTLPYTDRTQFAVFQSTDDISFYSYPYANIFNTFTGSAMQTGFAYDVSADKYLASMCQQGQNCPVIGVLPNNVNAGKYSLCIWANLTSDYTQNQLYFNGGSNLNASANPGNLFLTTPVSYTINNGNSNGPPFIQAEILEYSNVLSASNISTVANYLVSKWAISSFVTLS